MNLKLESHASGWVSIKMTNLALIYFNSFEVEITRGLFESTFKLENFNLEIQPAYQGPGYQSIVIIDV